ncbi:hypothetical protein JYU19_02350 [bacterium AH-315-J21]|nr:hypothetical protein [bacterium AH-315-J21]
MSQANFTAPTSDSVLSPFGGNGRTGVWNIAIACADWSDSFPEPSTPTDTVEVTVGVPLFNLLGPTSVQIKTDDEQATLTWTANPDDSGAFSFNVYRASDSAGYFQRLNRTDILALVFGDDDTEAPEMTFVDSTVYNQRTYYYSVVSVDYSGNESPRILIPLIVKGV